jgi:hypothetical protein
MPKETKFHGILAVGRTKADAVNNYRLLAMNKGATVQVDSERNIAFVAQASSADGMFNPMSGNMDLETDDNFIKQLEFNSNSSDMLEVNHLVCKSGCLAHVVFDSESLVKYCPHCTSSLSEDEGEESEAEPDGDEDDFSAEEGESESTDEEAEPEDDEELEEDAPEEDAAEEEAEPEEDAPEEDAAEEEAPEEDAAEEEAPEEDANPEEEEAEELPDLTEDDGEIVISSGTDDDKIVVVASTLEEATELFRKHQPTTSLSSDGKLEVSYHLCSNSSCGAHILASDDVAECPACDSPVVEPTVDEVTPVAPVVEASDCEAEDEECEDEEDNTLELTNDDGGVLEEDTEELDAMDDMDEEGSEESDSSAKLDVSYSSSVAGQARWTAFYAGKPVAMASKSSAGKNADLFDTPSFGHAVLATAKVAGVKKALAELGFESIKHRVSVSKAVRKMVDAQVAETQTALASEQQQFKDRFMAAIATASIGLNRGFYADKKNPVKAAMWNAMSSAGIRNPEALIDTAFKNHADAYHKTLFEIASDLTSKSADVQDSLSKAIAGMSYMEASTSAADESIEGRLEKFGTSVSSEGVKDQPVAPSSVGRQNISAAVRSLGRGR